MAKVSFIAHENKNKILDAETKPKIKLPLSKQPKELQQNWKWLYIVRLLIFY